MSGYKTALIIAATGTLLITFLYFTSISPDGAAIFKREGCVNCHNFKGQGGGIGPELTGVSQRKSDKWLKEHIKNSRVHNPYSKMPHFGHLSNREIKALIEHLKS